MRVFKHADTHHKKPDGVGMGHDSKVQTVDRAWGVLAGACLCMFCGVPAVVFYTFGVFVPEIVSATQWNPASVAAAIGPGALIVAVMAPLVGRLCDLFGVRPLAMIGGLAFGAGIALVGFGPQSSTTFVIFTMLMYLLAFAGTPIAYAHALTGWFDRRRGMALGVMFAAGALGIAVWPNLAAFLIQEIGWRWAYGVIGATVAVVFFLSGLLLLRNPPDQNKDVASPNPALGLRVAEAIRTATFWKIAAIFAILSAALGGAAVQLPVILRQQGADAQTAASIMSVVGISMLAGRLLLGFMLDRWFAPHLTIGITLISMLGFGLIVADSSSLSLFLAAALLGFGLGSEYAEVAYIVSRAFGFRAFGAIYGLVTLATGIGMAAGPAAMGVSLAVGINPQLIFSVAIAALVLPLILLITFKRSDLPFGTTPAAG